MGLIIVRNDPGKINYLKGIVTHEYDHSSVKLGSKTIHSIGNIDISEKQRHGEYHENKNTMLTNNNEHYVRT